MVTVLIIAWSGFFLLSAPWVLAHFGLSRWRRRARFEAPNEISWSEAVRIVVPARDEQRNIEACVQALRALPDGPWHAVIVDDHSADGTGEVARRAAADHPRITVIEAPERPRGWAGKPWACLTGAAGEEPWLLFLDADVRLDPRTPAAMVAVAAQGQLDLLSLFGAWTLPTLGERLLVPAFGWVIRGAIDPGAVRRGAVAFANGQCLLVRREAYRAVGGHRAVASAILDDVGLARAIWANGGRLDLRHAPWAFQVRLYRTVAEILRGYHKNLHVGLGRGRAVSLLAAGALIGLGLGPVVFVGLAWGLGLSGLVVASAALVALQVSLRFRLERIEGRFGVLSALSHPFGVAIVGATLAASALWPRATWRGTAYVGGQVSGP